MRRKESPGAVLESLVWRGSAQEARLTITRSRLVDRADIGTRERRDETIAVTRR